MRLESESVDGQLLEVRLDGRFDFHGYEPVEKKLLTLVEKGEASVLVDLSGVKFLASVGMRVLLRCAKLLSARGGRMVIASPQPLVGDVLRRAGIDTLIPLFQDIQSAREAVRQGGSSETGPAGMAP